MRILGVDPGSRVTGFGCIDVVENQLIGVAHGVIKTGDSGLEDRLLEIFQGLTGIIEKHRPQILVVEKVFFAKNALSALKLGQARGVAILSGKVHGLEFFEYNATEVKKTITGFGQADKKRVSKVIQLMVGQQNFKTLDASDALALAICHAYSSNSFGEVTQTNLLKEVLSARRKRKRQSMSEALGVKR
jgi:crossover junction endodeoxyribonuclease RuvC